LPLHPEIDLSVRLDSITKNHEDDRNNLRKILLDFLVCEKAGTGNKENTSKYRYNVELLSCGNKIYITRPVPLNKGFDFIIHAENYVFMNGRDNPKHDDILNDLIAKKQQNIKSYNKLLSMIEQVYLCHDPDDILVNESIEFKQGLPVDLILKIIKWLFIEQDVRYWNWSGRNMFMSGIKGI
jgi:hypothetical protein